MRTRFHTELKALLLKDDISFQSDLVNDIIYRTAEVVYPHTDNADKILGFNLSPAYWDKSEDLIFHLPKLSMAALKKLLKFFQIPEDDYVTNSPLTLNPDYVFNILLPKLNGIVETLKQNQDPLITKYREATKKIVAKMVEDKLSADTELAMTFIRKMEKGAKYAAPEIPILYRSLMSLENQLHYLATTGKATAAYEKVMALEFPVPQNEYLANMILEIKEALATYTRYRCYDAYVKKPELEKNNNAFFGLKQESDQNKESKSITYGSHAN